MPVYKPEHRVIEVRSDSSMGNKLLAKFYPDRMEIELKIKGIVYFIKLDDLLEFANKSQLDVFHTKVVNGNEDNS